MGFFISETFLHIVGWVYLFIRYGKRRKEMVEQEYLGHYSYVGREKLLQVFLFFLLVLIGMLLLSIPFFYLKKLF
jgi:uncharacterized membrane protein